MIDVFTKVVLAGACLFTFAWVILAQRRTIKLLSDAYLRLTHFQRVLAALAVIICTVYAQKPSTNDVEGVMGTNQVGGMSSMPRNRCQTELRFLVVAAHWGQGAIPWRFGPIALNPSRPTPTFPTRCPPTARSAALGI